MYAYFSLTEKQVLSLTVQYGSLDQALQSFPEVSLELNDGSAYEQKGKIDVISGIIDKTTGTVSMRAVFNNKDKRLMSGGQAISSFRMTARKASLFPRKPPTRFKTASLLIKWWTTRLFPLR